MTFAVISLALALVIITRVEFSLEAMLTELQLLCRTPYMDIAFLMITLASGFACGDIRVMMTMSCNMVAIYTQVNRLTLTCSLNPLTPA